MNKTSKPRLPAPKIDLSLEQQQQQPQQNLFNHPKDISITRILSEQKSKIKLVHIFNDDDNLLIFFFQKNHKKIRQQNTSQNNNEWR